MRWVNPPVFDVEPLPEGDVDGAVREIRSASLRELRNEAFLREEFLPRLGLNGEILSEFPEALHPWCDKGIRSWQYPTQFAPYLCYLADRDIRSYVEVGCRHGGTFIIVLEYIRRFSDLTRAVALDIVETPIMRDYASKIAGVEYRICSSLTAEARCYLGSCRWDLAFIDGDKQLRGLLERLRRGEGQREIDRVARHRQRRLPGRGQNVARNLPCDPASTPLPGRRSVH